MTNINQCECDKGFLCEHCEKESDAQLKQAFREYKLYAIKDDDGNTLDIRDVNFYKDYDGNVKILKESLRIVINSIVL